MADVQAKKAKSKPVDEPAEKRLSAAEEAAIAADQERALGRKVALILPIGTVVVAIVVGVVSSVGPAILVLAAGALLGTIVLLWASLRTLGGDAPLSRGFDSMGTASRHDALTERKERVLRALKDLENEHAIGKLDEDDYAEVSARYREEAKDIFRVLDGEVAPLRERAEALASAYLKKRGLAPAGYRDDGAAADSTDDVEDESADASDEAGASPAAESAPNETDASSEKIAKPPAVDPELKKLLTHAKKTLCPACGALNDDDATFCKKCAARLSDEKRDESDDDEKRADAT